MRERNCLHSIQGKSVCLVGNSKSLVDKNMGTVVDSHDIVIRCNNWQTYGIEKDTGMKTSVWALSTHWGRYDDSKWWPTFNYVWEALENMYKIESPWADVKLKGLFDPHKIRELWIIPSIINPCTLITDEHLSNVPEYVKIKELHHHKYVTDSYNELKERSRILTTGIRILHSLIYWRKHLSHLSIIGFGSSDPDAFHDNYRHYFKDEYSYEEKLQATDAAHDLEFEQGLIIDWINKGYIKRLEEEASKRL